MKLAPLLLVTVLGCSAPAPDFDLGPEVATLRIAWNGDRSARELFLDGERLGAIEIDGARQTLTAGSALATLEASERPLVVGQPYPQRLAREGRLGVDGPAIRQEYTLLAPAAPIDIEGLGLEVSSDEPRTNGAEHAAIRDWLKGKGLAPDTSPFERLHEQESGRELTVWYEISGRRVDGSVARVGSAEPAARFDSLFRFLDPSCTLASQQDLAVRQPGLAVSLALVELHAVAQIQRVGRRQRPIEPGDCLTEFHRPGNPGRQICHFHQVDVCTLGTETHICHQVHHIPV